MALSKDIASIVALSIASFVRFWKNAMLDAFHVSCNMKLHVEYAGELRREWTGEANSADPVVYPVGTYVARCRCVSRMRQIEF